MTCDFTDCFYSHRLGFVITSVISIMLYFLECVIHTVCTVFDHVNDMTLGFQDHVTDKLTSVFVISLFTRLHKV